VLLKAGPARDPMLLLGVGLLLVGFGFKTATVPFHMWVPDVYQGAPTAVTALIATGSKAAAFAALLRVFVGAVGPDWRGLLWGLALLTMTVGNVVAIAQGNLKRMLAYSSVAHAGYMLIGLVAGSPEGSAAILFYLLVYTFATMGAFGAILLLEREREEAVELSDYAGLGYRHPALALCLALFMLSLIGIPPLGGFVGKLYIFAAAIQNGYVWLAILGVLNSVVASYYYLRLIVYMYMREPEGPRVDRIPSFAAATALGIALWGTVQLGLYPAPLFDLAKSAVLPLFR
jgi:NADH-quinone oxidoreductase subunit N